MSPSSILFAGLMPHAPILVPSVGRSRLRDCRATSEAMNALCRRALATTPDVVIVLSPHSPLRRDAVGIWHVNPLEGSFEVFGSNDDRVALPLDFLLAHEIEEQAAHRGIRTWRIENGSLDHGAMVPLLYLNRAGWTDLTLVIGVNDLEPSTYERLGEAIAAAAANCGRRAVLIASGDMSHRLSLGAPCGFDPAGPEFDHRFVELLESGSPAAIAHIDRSLCDAAAEDVTAVTDIALAALGYETEHRQVLSYEGPFGVGYTVAILAEPTVAAAQSENPADVLSRPEELPALARQSVEAYFRNPTLPPPVRAGGELIEPRGVFVTVRTPSGDLRGCRGSARSTGQDVVASTWTHARQAAFDDPRFEPLAERDLPSVQFSVSVLSTLEPVNSTAELDPSRYGVLVTAIASGRRAVLLPDIPEVTTVATQLRLVRQKGHIGPHENVVIHRFTTREFHELTPGGTDVAQ